MLIGLWLSLVVQHWMVWKSRRLRCSRWSLRWDHRADSVQPLVSVSLPNHDDFNQHKHVFVDFDIVIQQQFFDIHQFDEHEQFEHFNVDVRDNHEHFWRDNDFHERKFDHVHVGRRDDDFRRWMHGIRDLGLPLYRGCSGLVSGDGLFGRRMLVRHADLQPTGLQRRQL